MVIMRESSATTILEHKARCLRRQTGIESLRSKLDTGVKPKELFKLALTRPVRMLLFSPIILCFSIFMAVVYGYLYLLFTTITGVFTTRYSFSQGLVGLSYLGIGVGMLIGVFGFGTVSDRILKKKAAGGELKPEGRLPPMIPGAIIIPAGLFLYGWSADHNVFWLVPILGTALVGMGLNITFVS